MTAEAKPPRDVFLTKKVYMPNLAFTPAQVEYTQRVNIDVGQ